ncbi:hypothetical protein BC937DRAFT_86468 [Endogone sp. FLAS-F59071]|nr:hypothetical protein BC937DRAFT_86468 [Endogone sp. FLAS-F59071]|eukprot:RUS22831.1 hypothetical protein BC937DRAFT_86468 [Endogone sp. FLAS-F59071]
MNMSSWMPPYLNTTCKFQHVLRNDSFSDQLYPGCTFLDQEYNSESQIITYYSNPLAPLYFADYVSCNQQPDPPSSCDGINAFSMSVRLLPNTTISPYAVVNLYVTTVETPYYENNLLDEFPAMVYNIIPGQYLRISFDFTENHDVEGNVFYTNTQTQTTTVVPLDSTEISDFKVVGIYFGANTAYYTIVTERYYHTWSELLGLIGGLYGGVASVFVLLFGVTRISPWGIFQTIIFKRVLSGPLREGFNPPDSFINSGTPFADRIPKSQLDNIVEDNAILRERVEKLEMFLSSYVIDSGLLGSSTERKDLTTSMESVELKGSQYLYK